MSTDDETFEALVSEVPTPRCGIDQVHSQEKPCPKAAARSVVWREECGGGVAVEGERLTLLCVGHLRQLVLSMNAGNVICYACDNVIRATDHLMFSLSEL